MAFSGIGSLPALQIDTGFLNPTTGINAYRQGVQDRVDSDQRNLLKQVGQTASTGNFLEAARTAMAGGDVKTGMDISNWDTGRRIKAIDFLTEGAQRADTPEKWAVLVNTAENAFGSDLVKNYRDFNSRPNALTALQSAQLKIQQTAAAREEREFSARMPLLAAQTREANAKADVAQRKSTGVSGQFDDPKDLAQVESEMRKEFNSQSKGFSAIRDGYRRIATGSKIDNGAGDLAIVYGYMKMLDPTSVVREGEFATAENTTGVPAYVMNLYNKVVEGARLPPEARGRFTDAAKMIYDNASEQYGSTRSQYESLARRKGIDPSNVIIDQTSVDPLKEARDAISKGAPRDAVIRRLRENGIDPSGL